MDLLNLEPSRPASFEDLNRQITAMSSQELKDLFVGIRAKGDHPQQALLENILTFQLMGRDPEGLLDLKVAYPDLPVLGRTYRMWAQSDPDAALAHVLEMDNETWYEVGLSALLQGLSDTQPTRAFETLRGLEKASEYDYENVFRSWLKLAPNDAAAAITAVPDPFFKAALTTVADNWAEIDSDATRQWIASLPAEQARIARPVFDQRMAQLTNQIDGAIPDSVKR